MITVIVVEIVRDVITAIMGPELHPKEAELNSMNCPYRELSKICGSQL